MCRLCNIISGGLTDTKSYDKTLEKERVQIRLNLDHPHYIYKQEDHEMLNAILSKRLTKLNREIIAASEKLLNNGCADQKSWIDKV